MMANELKLEIKGMVFWMEVLSEMLRVFHTLCLVE